MNPDIIAQMESYVICWFDSGAPLDEKDVALTVLNLLYQIALEDVRAINFLIEGKERNVHFINKNTQA